ncbi:MAG: serine hydrolase [Novosphingobium sp.]|nr:serine hydrolase [Novosphingobium sp.]
MTTAGTAIVAGLPSPLSAASVPTDPLDLDAVGQAALVANGDVSALELVEAAILRIEARDPALNTIATPCYERAIAAAKSGLPAGLFRGVPYLIKDVMNYPGVRTTSGSRLLGANFPVEAGEYARALERTGLNALGKSATPEFALLPTTESVLLGLTRNPWGLDHGLVSGPTKQRLRIAHSTINLYNRDAEPEVKQAAEAAARLCEQLGHHVERASIPADGELLLRRFFAVYSKSPADVVAAYTKRTGKVPDESVLEPFTLGMAADHRELPAEAVPEALKYFAQLERSTQRFFDGYDVTLTPVLRLPPPKLGYMNPVLDYRTILARVIDYASYTPLHNAAGVPAMSLPLGARRRICRSACTLPRARGPSGLSSSLPTRSKPLPPGSASLRTTPLDNLRSCIAMIFSRAGHKVLGRRLRTAAALLPASLLIGAPGAAQAPTRAPAPAAVTSPGPAALNRLENYVDGLMAAYLTNREVAGATIAVVADGKIAFSKGYGFADVDKGIPVDPATTLFRPGSVSKLLTWTALMQQVEQGKVDLDADVNTYLDFTIPATFERPIRVRDLLTHSPGFEDRFNGVMSTTPADFVELGAWMKTHIPVRVREPGKEISYSNYGSAIAGYIVERVSGEPFPAYIERHILRPLRMANSTFREPLPPEWSARAAKGYDLVDGQYVERPFELYHNIMPAGSMSATATDMGRFAIAHLQDGRYGDARILKPATARQMRQRLLANAPSLPGMAHGFIEYRAAGPRIIGHGGNTGLFHSYMLLAPEANIGFFVSMTGGDAASIARSELVELIVQRLFPTTPAPLWTGPRGEVPEGLYLTNRRTLSEPMTPGDLSSVIEVTAHGERGLLTKIRGSKIYWEQIGPQLYRQVTGATPMGPLGSLEFHGEGDDARMSFATQPHVLYHLMR